MAKLQQGGFVAYWAGGCVRDRLLGRVPKDYDIATNARPEEVQALFPRATGLTGNCFGVVRVNDANGEPFETATFRQDGEYSDGRRPDSVTFASEEIDAQRRDFTINGMFYDPVAGRLIDYVGGQADLEKRLVRAIGEASHRFQEDHLRLLRAVRFATVLSFSIETETMSAIKKLAPTIKTVSPERIRDELNKIMGSNRPQIGLDLLDQSGLLGEILPDISCMHGVEQPPQFHPEGDVYEHVRLMLTKMNQANLHLALGILFHDVGKKPTSKVDENGRIRFNEHESVGARMTEEIMTALRYDNKTTALVQELVQHHMQFKDVQRMRPSTLKKMMQRPTFELELELHRIDCSSSHGELENYRFLQDQLKTLSSEEINPPPLVNGNDLLAMGLTPGKAVGQILDAIKIAQLENQIETRADALAYARKLAREL